MLAIEVAIRGLAYYEGLVITVDHYGGFKFAWNGITFDGTCLPNEEAFINAYIHIRAHDEARQLVSRAKIVVD